MAKQSIVTLAQFQRMRGKQRASIAIQLNDRQWAAALKGIKHTSGKPPRGLKGLRLVATPGLGGGLIMPECPPPCRFAFVDGIFECSCTAGDGDWPVNGTPPTIRCGAWRIGSNGSIRCIGACADKRRTACRPVAWSFGGLVFLTTCACRRR